MAQVIQWTGFEYSYDCETWKPVVKDFPFKKPGQAVFMRYKNPGDLKTIQIQMNNGKEFEYPADGTLMFTDDRIIILVKDNGTRPETDIS